jgi:glucokinase
LNLENTMKKKYAVGIDIGGTNTVVGLVDAEGHVLARESFKTQQYPQVEPYVEAVAQRLKALLEAQNVRPEEVQGVGIGAPNGNFYTGSIEQAPNLPWKGVVPLAELLSEQTGLPVHLTNDAKAAAIGEMTYGVARGMKDFIMITLGTGVGSGIIVDGKPVYGFDGFAGELGHVTVVPDGRLCGCGRKGCLETYCSATGIVRTARELLAEKSTPSALRKLAPEELTSKDLYDAAVEGDALALEIFRRTGTMLGRALANFAVFSRPEAFVLFGGLAKAGHFIFDPVKEAMEEAMYPPYRGKIKLLMSSLKDADAAVLGASALAW